MRYVLIKSLLPRVNNTSKPPSPEMREIPLESGTPPPDSSPAEPHSSPGPPMISSVEMPNVKPASGNPASSKWNRRTIGKWFRTVMTKRRHNGAPPDTHPPSGIPLQTTATPLPEKPSTMAPGKRQKVSVPSCVDSEHANHSTQRTVGRSTVRPKARLSVLSVQEHRYLWCFAEDKAAKDHSGPRNRSPQRPE